MQSGGFPRFARKGIRRRTTSFCREGAGKGREHNDVLPSVDSRRIFCPAVPGPRVGPKPCRLHGRGAAEGRQPRGTGTEHSKATGHEGRKGKAGTLFLVASGYESRLQHAVVPGRPSGLADGCSAAGGTWAVCRSPLSSSPAVSCRIWPSGLFFTLPFPSHLFPH